MSSDLAIRVEGLSKAYVVRHKAHDHATIAQSALERIEHPFRRDTREEFWALRDVRFEVKQGQVLGVIGRNGAGKSTLLKLLTRITGPTAGRIDLWGRVGSLLEVGTGFHPELTGRENIYLNGSILGMRRKEIEQQFDAIVDFAGVEQFLDTPVKRYSSGMYVRLAFAVAAHLKSEILLLDEVLAVGDIEFQRKCLGTMRSIASSGRTVLLVSHTLSIIETMCDQAILLNAGRLVDHADARSTVATFRDLALSGEFRDEWPSDSELAHAIEILDVRHIDGPSIGTSTDLAFEVDLIKHAPVMSARLSFTVFGPDQLPVGTSFSNEFPLEMSTEQRFTALLCVKDHKLIGGDYSVAVSVGTGRPLQDRDEFHTVMHATQFTVPHAVGPGGIVDPWPRSGWGSVEFNSSAKVQATDAI